VEDFDENGQWSSDGIQVGELLECRSHNQLSKKDSERHNVVADFESSSIIQSVSVQQRVWICPHVVSYTFPWKPNKSREENCALQGYYSTSRGNFLRTFRDNLSVPTPGGGARIKKLEIAFTRCLIPKREWSLLLRGRKPQITRNTSHLSEAASAVFSRV